MGGAGTPAIPLSTASAPSIDALFTRVEAILDEGDVKAVLDFDSKYSFPTHAFFDQGEKDESFDATGLEVR